MRAASPAEKLTYDDFVLFPDDGKRHELINGEHFVTPSPNTKHQVVCGNLHWLLRSYLHQHPVGRVFFAPFDVVFSSFDVVEPDLLYMSHERATQILTEANVQGVPELVVEIASKSTRKRDETIKRHLYQRTGVAQYWVVDPAIEVVRIYRRADAGSGFSRPIEMSREAGDTLTTPLLPGFSASLDRIFDLEP
jgi:Uma2 family endonuclease